MSNLFSKVTYKYKYKSRQYNRKKKSNLKKHFLNEENAVKKYNKTYFWEKNKYWKVLRILRMCF